MRMPLGLCLRVERQWSRSLGHQVLDVVSSEQYCPCVRSVLPEVAREGQLRKRTVLKRWRVSLLISLSSVTMSSYENSHIRRR